MCGALHGERSSVSAHRGDCANVDMEERHLDDSHLPHAQRRSIQRTARLRALGVLSTIGRHPNLCGSNSTHPSRPLPALQRSVLATQPGRR